MENRKVFISILGTGNYVECAYWLGSEDNTCVTRFAQEATLKCLTKTYALSWNPKKDKVITFLTNDARRNNWNEDCSNNNGGMKVALSRAGFSMLLEDVSIPDGKSEEEIWGIFEKMYGVLEEGDELYIDVTHSFRYLPMLMLILADYSKFLKKTIIKSLTYCNYEGRDLDRNLAPIVDLKQIVELMDWTHAASDLIINGRAEAISKMTKAKMAICSKIEDNNEKDYYIAISELSRIFSNYVKYVQASDLRDAAIGVYVDSKKSASYDTEKKGSKLSALEPVIDKIREEFSNRFPYISKDASAEEKVLEVISLGSWCLEKKLYQQFLTIMREGIVSYLCNICGVGSNDEKESGKISDYVGLKINRGKKSDLGKRVFRTQMLRKYPSLRNISDEFIKTYGLLADMRNCLNHAWIGKKHENVRISLIDDNCNKILSFFKSYFSDENVLTGYSVEIGGIKACDRIFINLSNHPSLDWDETQLKAAEEFGRIEDIPFPNISPDVTENQIENLAKEYRDKILEKALDNEVTVHVMGEMTFCFTLISMLRRCNIPCLASCTERIVSENNGNKISSFGFVGFRKYQYNESV